METIIKNAIFAELDSIAERLAKKSEDGSYNIREVKRELGAFLIKHSELCPVDSYAEANVKQWEESRIQSTVKESDGQLTFGFEYEPESLIVLGDNQRIHMKSMSMGHIIKRQALLNDSMQKTLRGIGKQLEFYNGCLSHWTDPSIVTMDELQRQKFGWSESDE
jgi:hypothetical protein